ncbi:unnamed protein product [Clonostachys byssicola]|uniref:4-dimethylallyltryptophan N-methyltransferase n=1 Tax=Clonostachys byssicola TaxID=160290 RepID=A0A9N9US22_9HYPO|nr:unnamed protein product [Clonostachys byssicola]
MSMPQVNGDFESSLPLIGTVVDACGGDEGISQCFRSMLDQKLLWTRDQYRPIGMPQRVLPSPLLSDAEGLKLWRDITRLPTYYQTEGEIEFFNHYGHEIAGMVPPNAVLVDLGCGDVRKAKALLDHLEQLGNSVCYFALDLDKASLEHQMGILTPHYRHVRCFGLWGTFDHGLAWLNDQAFNRPRFLMSLGSIYGNDHFHDAVKSLEQLRTTGFHHQTDKMLLTMDGTQDAAIIWRSYHDHAGLFEKFIRNGYKHSNRVLNQQWYRDEDWDFVGLIQQDPLMHRFVIRARVNVTCPALKLDFPAGTEIDCYEAFKYPPDLMRRQFAMANFHEVGHWKAPKADLHHYLLVPSEDQAPMAI